MTTAAACGFRHWDKPELVIETRAGASVQTQIVAALARPLIRWPVTASVAVAERLLHSGRPALTRFVSPFAQAEFLAGLQPAPRGIERRAVQLPECRAEWVSASSLPGTGRAVIYLHGGGFVGCGLNTHRRIVARISAAAGAPVLNVDYRLLPHHPITEAIEDGVDAWRRVLEEGVRPENIVLAGDSSGGLIALSVALRALEHGLPPAAGLVTLAPWVDLDTSAKHRHPNARLDPAIPVTGLDLVVDHFIAQGRGLDPALSPVNRDLTGLPPTLIQVGSTEVLRVDAELLADRLADAGVPVRLQVWDRQIHDFQLGLVPEARKAVEEIGKFIRASMTPESVELPAGAMQAEAA